MSSNTDPVPCPRCAHFDAYYGSTCLLCRGAWVVPAVMAIESALIGHDHHDPGYFYELHQRYAQEFHDMLDRVRHEGDYKPNGNLSELLPIVFDKDDNAGLAHV